MYYIFPDADCSFVEVVPGTAFAAVGIAVAQVVFTAFKSGSAGGNLVASILVLLTWLYVVGLVILLGVVINAVLSNRSKDVDIEPVVGGVPRRRGQREAAVDRETLVAELTTSRNSSADGASPSGSNSTAGRSRSNGHRRRVSTARRPSSAWTTPSD
ncbi:YhjD/YihY/BrkB family envelope integrity protein [Halomicroarcula sp. GCM10025709]|uniref:YhjD/YihY/BrkB family envelope integrity protein n=1 Tax=Halomicroarcula sp. GCM10025709 TaxID=3252669 RepID=UPI0036067378